MRKVQIVGAPKRTRVEILVAREGEPGGEVRRVEPGVAENASVTGLDKQSGVAERSYLQLNLTFLPIYQSWHSRPGDFIRERGSPCAPVAERYGESFLERMATLWRSPRAITLTTRL